MRGVIMSVDITANPFFLNDEQVKWVENTISSMTTEEKVGQLFCTSLATFSKKTVKHYTEDIKIGGLMLRPFEYKGLKENIRALQQSSKIPLLISANLEAGGNGILKEGTYFAMPEGVSATNDFENGYRLGKIACREAAAVGVNWSFAPLVDIDMNFRNPITNIRSFGADKEVVLKMARNYLKAAKEECVAPTLKHFPGDGTDERDQHLLTSVNLLSAEEWEDTFGYVYKILIEEGAPCIMAGHIAQPAMARKINPGISDRDAFLPSSLSRTLLTNLLREKLGFNGLIVTDSTLMVGFMQYLPRKKAVPLSIECGCDMFLFNRNLDEDYSYMLAGLKEGILSEQRLDEAVTRILALKAMLNLHVKHKRGDIVPYTDPFTYINNAETQNWVKECADKAVTLVKNTRNILPLSPQKTKRVYLNVIENYADDKSEFAADIKRRLECEGFEVELRKRELDVNPNKLLQGAPSPNLVRFMKEMRMTTNEFVSKYDMCVLVLNMETVSNATTVRINWKMLFGLGNDIPWYAGEMPLAVISTANPYHLLDIPMAHVYINAYSNNSATLDAVFDKIMGRSEFKGGSPVDPFCGHEDCRI